MKKQIFVIALLIFVALCLTACSNTEDHTHTPVTDAAVAATCTESGLTEGSHCADCSEIITPQEVVPALGHDYDKTKYEATCLSSGKTVYTCNRCAHQYETDFVSPATHRFTDSGKCVICETAAPTEALVPNTEWYTNTRMTFNLSTKEELAGLAVLVNGGTSFNGMTIYLDGDIDLGYYEWTPIGNSKYAFNGTFDGQGHVIRSLKISSDISYSGLFGKSTGEIMNFTIDNASIYVKGIQNYVAVVCAYTTNAIKNVTVDGYVDARLANYVAGVAAYASGDLMNIVSTTNVIAGEYAGGIVGYAKISSAQYKDITNNGNITGSGVGHTGGIVGRLEPSASFYAENCRNNADVSGVDYVGGLIGSYSSSAAYDMKNCVNYGDIEGRGYIGGICGHFNRPAGIVNSIMKEFSNYGEVHGIEHVGGLFGYCISGGNPTYTEFSNHGDVVGTSRFVGGVFGYADFDGIILSSLVNEANVTGTQYTGGLFGNFCRCENDFDIIDSKNNGNISGTDYTGGLFGCVSSVGTPSITRCENNGSVSGMESVGGFIGNASFAGTFVASEVANNGVVKASAKYVGGFAGYVSAQIVIISEYDNLGDITSATDFVGGCMGYLHSNNNNATIDKCSSTAAICGASSVGGMFGYVNANTSSIISNCSVKCDISAQYIVGGIAGEVINIIISNCTNEGSTIAVSGSLIQSGAYYAYVGGIVGVGNNVQDSKNYVTIDYENRGLYVGGIAGYLRNYATACKNYADISGFDYVGGIAGYIKHTEAAASAELVNQGNISGFNFVGGIYGRLDYSTLYELSNAENSGNITASGKYIGGITGYCARVNNSSFAMSGLKNSGDVTSIDTYVGGLFGYIYGYDASSVVEDSSSDGDVAGYAMVGGLIGNGVTMTLKNSSNKGASVKASGFIAENGYSCAYLGGYIGYGYNAVGLANDADVVSDLNGAYVGGIAGGLTYGASECTNTGKVGGDSLVGGIAGYLYSVTTDELTNLVNRGSVAGNNFAGGLFGKVEYYGIYILTSAENYGNVTGNQYVGGLVGHFGRYRNNNFTFTTVSNAGDIVGAGGYVGGLFGYIGGYGADSVVENAVSSGNVTGAFRVGGLIGEAASMTLKNAQNNGDKVTATGLEGANVYLGGCVGNGDFIVDATNKASLVNEKNGNYVGGIAGYLKNSPLRCENSANVSGNTYVGGIAGVVAHYTDGAVTSLKNSGNVSGYDHVGGVVGRFEYYNVLDLSDCENVGNVSGNQYVGGIIGSLARGRNVPITISALTNRGDVTAECANAGGLFGYAAGYGADSVIKNCSSVANVTGTTKVDALVGELVSVTITDCTSEGSKVTTK